MKPQQNAPNFPIFRGTATKMWKCVLKPLAVKNWNTKLTCTMEKMDRVCNEDAVIICRIFFSIYYQIWYMTRAISCRNCKLHIRYKKMVGDETNLKFGKNFQLENMEQIFQNIQICQFLILKPIQNKSSLGHFFCRRTRKSTPIFAELLLSFHKRILKPSL